MCGVMKLAKEFVKEMIEHGYLNEMTTDEIVTKACEMAYKLHEALGKS